MTLDSDDFAAVVVALVAAAAFLLVWWSDREHQRILDEHHRLHLDAQDRLLPPGRPILIRERGGAPKGTNKNPT